MSCKLSFPKIRRFSWGLGEEIMEKGGVGEKGRTGGEEDGNQIQMSIPSKHT